MIEKVEEMAMVQFLSIQKDLRTALHQILFTKGINNELPMVRWY